MSRRFLLRAGTAQAHAALDATVGTFASRESYRRYLQGLYAFRAPLEEALEGTRLPAAFGSWRPKTVREALSLDLNDLGCPPPERVKTFVISNEVTRLLGVLYVLEGASLGARVLEPRAQRLGLHASFGARHLAQQTLAARNWNHFVEVLEGIPGIELKPVVEAACATFALAQQAFEEL
jgi:heme oxygenase